MFESPLDLGLSFIDEFKKYILRAKANNWRFEHDILTKLFN